MSVIISVPYESHIFSGEYILPVIQNLRNRSRSPESARGSNQKCHFGQCGTKHYSITSPKKVQTFAIFCSGHVTENSQRTDHFYFLDRLLAPSGALIAIPTY